MHEVLPATAKDCPDPFLRFWVQSSDPWLWHFVDLSEPGDPDAPLGYCSCTYMEWQTRRLMQGKDFKLCRHLKLAREYLREQIAAGHFDQYITPK